jgi:hypothetical protein
MAGARWDALPTTSPVWTPRTTRGASCVHRHRHPHRDCRHKRDLWHRSNFCIAVFSKKRLSRREVGVALKSTRTRHRPRGEPYSRGRQTRDRSASSTLLLVDGVAAVVPGDMSSSADGCVLVQRVVIEGPASPVGAISTGPVLTGGVLAVDNVSARSTGGNGTVRAVVRLRGRADHPSQVVFGQ